MRGDDRGDTGGGTGTSRRRRCPARGGCEPGPKGHDLAPLSGDMRSAPGRWPNSNVPSKRLIWPTFCGRIGLQHGFEGRCGTLTYRQMLKAKSQPCRRIAAAQQTQVRAGARRCGKKRNEPIGCPSWTSPGERQAAALSQDVLGFGAAIGLIRFVRSASSRG